MPESKKPSRGQPQAELDIKQLETLCTLQCTTPEIAAFFGVSEKTIERHMKRNAQVVDAMERGRAKGRVSLRRAQYMKAMSGNPVMLIWLGKQLLGQRDKSDHELSGKDGAPLVALPPIIEIEFVDP